MVYWSLAVAMALAHGLLAVFLVFGAPVAARWPRVMRWYLAMLVPTAAVNILSLPCPLTVWEKDFWRLAGETPYRGGFISHYFVEPFYAPGLGPSGETALLIAMVLWCLPWLLYPVVSRTRRSGTGSDFLVASAEQRLIDEGLRMEDHPAVKFREGPSGRRAVLVGGPEVADVIASMIGGDVPVEDRSGQTDQVGGDESATPS